MEADLYDEFGNYIGPEIESDEESEDDDEVGEEEAVEYVSWEDALEQFCRELEMYGPICIDACRFQNVMKTSTLPSLKRIQEFIVWNEGLYSKKFRQRHARSDEIKQSATLISYKSFSSSSYSILVLRF